MPKSVEVRFVVEQNYAGWRLDRYLCEKIRRLSRAQAKRIIERDSRERDLAGQGIKPASRLRPGQILVFMRRCRPEPEAPDGLPILHEDDDLIVVDKPAGLAMHPTALYVVNTLVARVRELCPGEKPDPAHRLDRETSGVVVCGKRPEVTGRLKLAFARGLVNKTYLAIVEGHPPDAFSVDLPLSVGGKVVRVRAVVDRAAGKEARTRVSTIERRESAGGEPFALVRAEPLTGRQHQIRAHLAAAGFPVVGDKIYGPDETIFVRFTEGRMTGEDSARLRLTRHALHAARVELEHPTRREGCAWESRLPSDLESFFDGLRGSPGQGRRALAV